VLGAPTTESLILNACRIYHGEPLEDHLDPATHQLVNPLLVTRLGRAIYAPAFRAAFFKNDYISRSVLVDSVLASPQLDAILYRCYGSNEAAKMNFIALVQHADYDAKYSAGYLQGIGFAFGGALIKVAVSAAALKSAMIATALAKWSMVSPYVVRATMGVFAGTMAITALRDQYVAKRQQATATDSIRKRQATQNSMQRSSQTVEAEAQSSLENQRRLLTMLRNARQKETSSADRALLDQAIRRTEKLLL